MHPQSTGTWHFSAASAAVATAGARVRIGLSLACGHADAVAGLLARLMSAAGNGLPRYAFPPQATGQNPGSQAARPRPKGMHTGPWMDAPRRPHAAFTLRETRRSGMRGLPRKVSNVVLIVNHMLSSPGQAP